MNLDLMNRLSDASISGYYDPTLKLVVVWFYNDDKPDLVAYLQHDMSWDLREVIGETSTLTDTGETIVVSHQVLDPQPPKSDFDNLVRSAIDRSLEDGIKEEAVGSVRLEMMKMILDANSYRSIDN